MSGPHEKSRLPQPSTGPICRADAAEGLRISSLQQNNALFDESVVGLVTTAESVRRSMIAPSEVFRGHDFEVTALCCWPETCNFFSGYVAFQLLRRRSVPGLCQGVFSDRANRGLMDSGCRHAQFIR